MTAADRVRRSRQRRKLGAVLIRYVLHAEGVADLIALGWIRPGASPAEVRAGMIAMTEAALDARIAAKVVPLPIPWCSYAFEPVLLPLTIINTNV